jgi:hypothetical protein
MRRLASANRPGPDRRIVTLDLGRQNRNLFGRGHRQRADETVHHAEDGGVDANAQRDGDDHHDREARALPQLAKSCPKVLQQGLHREVPNHTAPAWPRRVLTEMLVNAFGLSLVSRFDRDSVFKSAIYRSDSDSLSKQLIPGHSSAPCRWRCEATE